MVRNIVAEKLARSTYEAEEVSGLSPPAPSSSRHSTIESNPPLQPPAPASLSFRNEAEQFHLVGFEPAYGNYRRHTPQGQGADDEEEDEEDDGDFLEWARIIGER